MCAKDLTNYRNSPNPILVFEMQVAKLSEDPPLVQTADDAGTRRLYAAVAWPNDINKVLFHFVQFIIT